MTTTYIIANILGILVLTFNIWICIKVWKSNIEKKNLRIILTVFLNLPTIVIYSSTGWELNLFQFQIWGFGNDHFQLGLRLFFSFPKNHFNDPFVFISVPIGAFYVLYKFESWIRDKEYADEGI